MPPSILSIPPKTMHQISLVALSESSVALLDSDSGGDGVSGDPETGPASTTAEPEQAGTGSDVTETRPAEGCGEAAQKCQCDCSVDDDPTSTVQPPLASTPTDKPVESVSTTGPTFFGEWSLWLSCSQFSICRPYLPHPSTLNFSHQYTHTVNRLNLTQSHSKQNNTES